MKNLIVKTAVITLASIISLLAITFGALSIIMPKTVANIFDNLGAKGASIFLYQMDYERTDDIQDLIDIIDKTYANKDHFRQEKYLDMLIAREDFDSFCLTSDRESFGKDDCDITTKEYYYGYYASVLYQNAKFDKAIEIANEFVSLNGYTEFNPLTILLDEFCFKFTDEQVEKIEMAIKDAKSKNNEQKEYKNKDLNYIKILNTIN